MFFMKEEPQHSAAALEAACGGNGGKGRKRGRRKDVEEETGKREWLQSTEDHLSKLNGIQVGPGRKSFSSSLCPEP